MKEMYKKVIRICGGQGREIGVKRSDGLKIGGCGIRSGIPWKGGRTRCIYREEGKCGGGIQLEFEREGLRQ